MSSLFLIACLLFIGHIDAVRLRHFNDNVYNPCNSTSNVFFYPDPTDPHRYYQCDESNIAYPRDCGTLVWDPLILACNWPVVTDSTTPTTPTTTTTIVTTTTTRIPFTFTFTTTKRTTTATSSVSFSLCAPFNPCGDHGDCIEAPMNAPLESRRFACICDDNWFGRLCDKRVDDLTTPALV